MHPIKVAFRLIRDKKPSLKLLSATLLAVLMNAGVLEDRLEMLKILVLPTLVKLMNERDNTIKERTLLVLAYFLDNNEELQKVSGDIGLVQKLAPFLLSISTSTYSDTLKEACNFLESNLMRPYLTYALLVMSTCLGSNLFS
jgi:hypothetical protein